MNFLYKLYCRTFQFGFKLALPFFPYKYPHILENNNNIAEELKSKNIDSVLIVTDKTVLNLGLVKNLEESLKIAKIRFKIFDETVANPTIENVESAKKAYIENNCRAIIAVGGGSVIDCAKVTGAMVVKKNKTVSQLKGILKVLKPTPLLFAIPTTAGTGSETTIAAVITDPDKCEKYAVTDFNLMPDYAILDYKNVIDLPKKLTAYTGLDSLVHAIEAYIGNTTTNETRALSEKAVYLINKYLLTSYQNGSDTEARKNMLQAAYFAGASFTRSYVGYVHAISHTLTAKYGIQHGLANATILPIILEEYGSKITKKLAKLARNSKLVKENICDDEAAKFFINWIKYLNEQMEIPRGFKEIPDEDLNFLAQHAAAEANPLYPVPVLYNKKELIEICKRIQIKE